MAKGPALLASTAALALACGLARADDPDRPTERAGDDRPTEPEVHVTLPWLATQLVPSPALALGNAGVHFGLGWQVTPLLFSWGIHRGLSPWRFLVVEPYVRQSGSVELFVAPELFTLGPSVSDGDLSPGRGEGVPPLVEHGEYLSASVGVSAFDFQGQANAAYEVGAYVLFGVVGVQLTASPTSGPLAFVAALHLRYF